MIVVHHLEKSRSHRALWLLEELGVPYEVERYERNPATLLAPPALRKVHPLGKAPVITDGALTLAESGAILEYLVGRYGKGRLRPAPGTAEEVRYLHWMHYAEGAVMPPLLLRLIFSRVPARMPFFLRPVAKMIARGVDRSFIGPQIALHLDYLEGALAESYWFAGDEFSAADIQLSYPLEAAAARGVLGSGRLRLAGFIERIRARPAYQRAVERGGPHGIP